MRPSTCKTGNQASGFSAEPRDDDEFLTATRKTHLTPRKERGERGKPERERERERACTFNKCALRRGGGARTYIGISVYRSRRSGRYILQSDFITSLDLHHESKVTIPPEFDRSSIRARCICPPARPTWMTRYPRAWGEGTGRAGGEEGQSWEGMVRVQCSRSVRIPARILILAREYTRIREVGAGRGNPPPGIGAKVR